MCSVGRVGSEVGRVGSLLNPPYLIAQKHANSKPKRFFIVILYPCPSIAAHALKGASIFSPSLPTHVYPFLPGPSAGSCCTNPGKQCATGIRSKPWRCACCRIICIAFGNCRKGIAIIRCAGRKSSACLRKGIWSALGRGRSATIPASGRERRRSGSVDFGSMLFEMRRISRAIWIIFISTRSNMVWWGGQWIGRGRVFTAMCGRGGMKRNGEMEGRSRLIPEVMFDYGGEGGFQERTHPTGWGGSR